MELFFTAQHQIKLYHWATMDYAAHKALDSLHDSLSSKIDTFMECYIGRFRKQPIPASFAVSVKVQADVQKIEKTLETFREGLKTLSKSLAKETQLVNIIDEMLGDIDQTQYLLKLK